MVIELVSKFWVFSRRLRFTSIILTLLICGGCTAFFTEDCPTRCQDFNPYEQWLGQTDAPDLQMLKLYCPKILQMASCRLKEIDNCLGGKLLHLAFSANRSLASFSKVIFVTVNLIQQICEEHSSLHTDYVENIGCYKTHFTVISDSCKAEVRQLESQFVSTFDLSQEKDIACKMGLFSGPYMIECTSELVGRACGEKAKAIYRKLLLMFKDAYFIRCPGFNKNWREDYMEFLINYARKRLNEMYDAFFERLENL